MFAVQIANYLLPLITIPIVARALGPENLGLIGYIGAIVAYFSLLVGYSFNYTGVRRVTRTPEKSSDIFSIVFTTQIILLTVSSIVFFICIYLISDLNANYILALITFLSCVSILFTPNWFLQAKSDFKMIAILSLIAKILSVILIFVYVNNFGDILIYATILHLVTLLVSLLAFFVTIAKYKIKLELKSWGECWGFMVEDRYLFLSSIVTNLYTTTGIVLLGAISTNQEVGYYTSAQKIIEVAKSIVILPISQIIFPILSEKFGKNKEDGIQSVKILMPIFIVVGFFILFSLIIISKYAILILFGEKFLPSVDILIILSFGLMSVFFGIIVGGQVMLNLGLDNIFVRIQVIISILSVILNYFLIPYGGGKVTAFVWSVCEFVIFMFQVFYLRSKGVILFDKDVFRFKSLKRSIFYVFKRGC